MNDYQADRPLRLVTKQQTEADVTVLPVCSECKRPCQTIKVERPTWRLLSRCCHAGLKRAPKKDAGPGNSENA